MADHTKALADALERLMRNFPTDTDMLEAGWTGAEVECACQAHDAARETLAAYRAAQRAAVLDELTASGEEIDNTPAQQAPSPTVGEREAFEADYMRRFGKNGRLGFDEETGRYGHVVTQARWESWQARAALAPAAQAEPVAWRWRPSEVFGEFVFVADPDRAKLARTHGMFVEALYTAPPSNPPAQGKEPTP
jgi:hypothetical protein